ncbi:MAG: hypothetical protein Aurels2KO_06280 [Aureliella sp.]
MMKSKFSLNTLCVGLLTTLPCVLLGCTSDTTTSMENASTTSVSDIDGAPFLLAAEPEAAQNVIQAREVAGDGDEVVVVGRIGGSANPWIDGRAAFSIVDGSLKACTDIPGDNCPKPWDYCCETSKLPGATALVKVVDKNGDIVKADAKTLLNVKELSTVVVQGKAQRDEAGNLTVLATGVFVKEQG